jgi:hypothetical protein
VKVLSKLVLASMVIATACGATQKSPRSRMSAKDMVTAFKPAIVRIEVGPDRVGTGFVIDGSGLVATNLHVVVAADDIKVKMADGAVHAVKRVRAYDKDHDLAILDIDPPGEVPALKLGDSDAAAPGDPVLAIGNPLGVLDYTVSDGLLSAVRVLSPEMTLLQTTAPISQGSSGGPLFNGYGEVIGIVNAFLGGGQNLNFAIPAKYLVTLATSPSRPQTMAEFKAATEKLIEAPEFVREVPDHKVEILTGCKPEHLIELTNAIDAAIKVGAPLYNDGNIQACVDIYSAVVSKYERESPCPGIRSAFGHGLLRVEVAATAKAKAWALRDTFDGMLSVIARKTLGPSSTPGGAPDDE